MAKLRLAGTLTSYNKTQTNSSCPILMRKIEQCEKCEGHEEGHDDEKQEGHDGHDNERCVGQDEGGDKGHDERYDEKKHENNLFKGQHKCEIKSCSLGF